MAVPEVHPDAAQRQEEGRAAAAEESARGDAVRTPGTLSSKFPELDKTTRDSWCCSVHHPCSRQPS